MITTDSQDFKEIQDIDVHHVVTLEVDFPNGQKGPNWNFYAVNRQHKMIMTIK